MDQIAFCNTVQFCSLNLKWEDRKGDTCYKNFTHFNSTQILTDGTTNPISYNIYPLFFF